jgi:curved DNA-binding protein CbpA
LLELHRTQRSCVVRFERSAVKRQLVLSGGLLVYAESNLPEEHLAHVLLSMDLLARQDLKGISSWMKNGKSSEEAIVLATGLDDERLAEAVREQAERILASLFGWAGCELRLFDGNGPIRRRCRLALPLPQALVEAARRAVRDRILPAAIAGMSGFLCADPAAGERANLPLNSAEAYAYAQVSLPTTLAQLVPLLPEGEVKPGELVQRLLLLGLLRLEAAAPEQISSASLQEQQLTGQIDELLQHFEVANHYDILSVPSDANEEVIKSAYHEMARLYHPDRFEAKGFSPGFRAQVERLFTYITGAYTTLCDQAARASYDETRLMKESQVETTLQGRATGDADKDKIAETLFNAGRASIKKKEFEKAVEQLRECVWLRPGNSRYHHYLGVAQAEIVALRKEAEQHFLKAIELENMNADSYLQLGKLYLKVNLPKRAEAQFCEALRWDSENAEALQLIDSLGRKR